MNKVRTAMKRRQGGIILCMFFILSFFMASCSNPGSNPGNTLDTGIIEKGFFPSGEKDAKWMYMTDDAVILLKSGDEGKLHFQGLVAPSIFNSVYGGSFGMTFVINDEPAKLKTINKVYDGYFDVVYDVPKNKKIRVQIKVDKYYATQKDGTKRSMIVNRLDAK